MDWLKEAKEAKALADSLGSADREAPMIYASAMCAVLIAIAEAMQAKPQFVQVGDERLRAAYIGRIETYTLDDVLHVTVWMLDMPCAMFQGPDATAFLAWWAEHADVVRLEESQ